MESTGCSDKKPCQQVLDDGKWYPPAKLADVQATWLPDSCCPERLFSFTENLATVWHLAHPIVSGWMFLSAFGRREDLRSLLRAISLTLSGGQASHVTITSQEDKRVPHLDSLGVFSV